jgi:hypothetical protein
MKRYSHSKVLKIFPDIDPALLKSWLTLGLIAPDLKSKGVGIFKKYTTDNLIEIGVARELFAFGVKQAMAEPIIQSLREHLRQAQDFDLLIICRRQYVSTEKMEMALVTEIIKAKKTRFKHESAYMLFNQSQGNSAGGGLTSSALVISVADIWDYIMNRL